MCVCETRKVTVSFQTALEREIRGDRVLSNLFLSPCLVFFTQGHSLQPPSGPTEQKTVFITTQTLPLCPERKSAWVFVKLGCLCRRTLSVNVCECVCVGPLMTSMVDLNIEEEISRQ